MSWELEVLRCKGSPPARRNSIRDGDRLVLGSTARVRDRIRAACVKHRRSDPAAGVVPCPDLLLQCDGLGDDGTAFGFSGYGAKRSVTALIVTVENVGNPFPVLRRLCGADGWAVYEMTAGLPLLDLSQDLPCNRFAIDLPDGNVVTRSYLAAVLERWRAGQLAPSEIQQWASAITYNFELEYDDWEAEHNESVASEIVGALALLGINRITAKDVPMYLAFLQTPIGNCEAGRRILARKQRRIDYSKRDRELRGVWPYDLLAKRS